MFGAWIGENAAMELIWGAFGVLIALFLAYFLAHAWVIRPIIERIDRNGRFPFLDRVMGPPPEDVWERLRKNREDEKERGYDYRR